MDRPVLVTWAKLFATASIWGGTFVAGRVVAETVPPFSAGFLRFAIASCLLVPLALREHGGLPHLQARQWFGLVLLGLTGVLLYNACFFYGLQTVEAGRAAVIIANNPVFIALFAALLLRERLSRLNTLGVLISVVGAATVISRGDPVHLFSSGVSRGDLALMGCVASWVTYSLLGKVMMRGLSALVSVACSVLFGTLFLLPFALAEGLATGIGDYEPVHWANLAFLGVLGTVVGFTWYYQGVQRLGAARAGVFINFVPVSGVLLGWWLLGEPVSGSLVVGGLLVLVGVALANRR